MENQRKALSILALAVCLTGTMAFADTVVLTDGRVLEGQIGRKDGQMVVTQADGLVVPIRAGELQKVTLNETHTAAQLAQADWDRTVLQIKKSDNLGDIVRLHKVMLAAYPDQPITPTIQESLAAYQKLAAGDFVKFRSQWVSRVKVEVLLRQATEKAKESLDLYRASRLKDALATANDALKLDEENAMALSLAGLSTYRQNQLATAHDYFAKLAAADVANVLAWNNLAVIAWDQKHPAEALLDYTKALSAMSDNRLVLDNITEAINSYSGAKDTPLYMDLVRQYNLAEAKMEAKLAKVNLYRLGSTWVSKDDRDKFNSSVADVRKNMTDLDSQYQQAVKTLAGIDDQIKAATDAVNTATAEYNNATGTLVVLQARGLIDPYWNDARDLAYQNIDRATKQRTALEQQKTQLIASVKQMRADAVRLKGVMAWNQSKEFGGFQRIMELGEAENPPAPILIDPTKASANIPEQPNAAAPQIPAPAAPAQLPLPPPMDNGLGYGPPVFYDGSNGWPTTPRDHRPATQPSSPPTPTPSPTPPPRRWKTMDSLSGTSGGTADGTSPTTQPQTTVPGRIGLP